MAAAKTQGRRIVDIFGGVTKLQNALKAAGVPRDRVTIYRWTVRRGAVPTRAMTDIAAAARLEGILLPSEAFDPREIA